MKPAIQKIIEIIYDVLFIGKTAAKDIQISKDISTAKRLKKAIEEGDEEKARKIISKDFVILDDSDIIGICTTPQGPAVIFSVPAAVKFRQMYKDIRRCKRAKGV